MENQQIPDASIQNIETTTTKILRIHMFEPAQDLCTNNLKIFPVSAIQTTLTRYVQSISKILNDSNTATITNYPNTEPIEK